MVRSVLRQWTGSEVNGCINYVGEVSARDLVTWLTPLHCHLVLFFLESLAINQNPEVWCILFKSLA